MATPQLYRLRLVLTPDPSGGFTVTSPDLPELLTEGETAADALANVRDALAAVRELYIDLGRPLPRSLTPEPGTGPVEFETLIEAA
jgi:antitoxin HicB